MPIVIYNGLAQWSAALNIGDEIAPAEAALKRFQPRQDYLLLDIHRMRPAELPAGNVVSARFALEHGDPKAVPAIVKGLRHLLAGPEHARLRRIEALEDLDAMTTMFEKRLDDLLAERGARERALGEALGLERERALLARLAGRKFGPDAASRLAAAVAGVDDPGRLEEVGEEAIVCANSAEFLARAEDIARRR